MKEKHPDPQLAANRTSQTGPKERASFKIDKLRLRNLKSRKHRHPRHALGNPDRHHHPDRALQLQLTIVLPPDILLSKIEDVTPPRT